MRLFSHGHRRPCIPVSFHVPPTVDELDDRELVRLDLPGCGLSPAPPLPMRIPRIAALITDVMDSLGLQRADVLGFSFGGVVALELAHRFPERISRLVLVSTTPGTPGAVPHPAVVAMMLSPIRYYNRSSAELVFPLIAGGQTARDQHQMRSGLQEQLTHPTHLRGYAYHCWRSRLSPRGPGCIEFRTAH
jgi:poly(3-hydroxyoctanoate) depolymerase